MSGGGGRLGWAGGVKPPVTLNVRRKRNLKKGQKKRGEKKKPKVLGVVAVLERFWDLMLLELQKGFFA